MGKILLIVSAVISLATAGLGFVNKGKLATAQEETAAAESKAQAAEAKVADTAGKLKSATDTLATTTAEKEQLAAQAKSAQDEADKAKADLTAATAGKAESDAKVTQLTTENEALKTAAATQTTAAPAVDNSVLIEKDAQIQELTTLNAKLQQDLDSVKTRIVGLQKVDDDRRNRQMRNGLEGKILAVNPAWNFVVLNLGDKNGVISNAELLVKRNNQFVGKIRVTSVEPSTSIADIVSKSVAQGVTIAPGDSVIYQAVQD